MIENKGAVDCSAAETLIQVRGENVSSVRVYGDYWELGEPVKHGVMKSGRKDMQRVLERGIRDEIYADSSIVANIETVPVLSSYYGSGTVGRVWHILVHLLFMQTYGADTITIL